jgi:F0F1-type ATP synthase membrane subunit a
VFIYESLLKSLSYFAAGLSKKCIGYFKRYVQPTPVLLPINILEDFILEVIIIQDQYIDINTYHRYLY